MQAISRLLETLQVQIEAGLALLVRDGSFERLIEPGARRLRIVEQEVWISPEARNGRGQSHARGHAAILSRRAEQVLQSDMRLEIFRRHPALGGRFRKTRGHAQAIRQE